MEEIAQLRLSTPRSEWLHSLSAFVNEYDASSSSKASTDHREIVKAIEIVVEKLADRSGSIDDDTQIELLVLDAMRILLRFRAELDQPLTMQLMSELVKRACRANCSLHLKQLAVRCLINLLFDNEQNVRLFTSLEVDGLNRLGVELCSPANADLEALNFHFYIVRLAYMMVSQSASILSDTLSPTEGTTKQLVRAVIICMHSCSAAASAAEKGPPEVFPQNEATAKLYLETSKLLYALSVHDVLQNCATEPVTTGNTTADRGVTTNDSNSTSALQLKRLLGESILCALTAGEHHEVNEVRNGSTGTAVLLRDYAEQCEETALQLAMYAPADMLTVSLPTEIDAGESKADSRDDRDSSGTQSVAVRLTHSVLRILERLLRKGEQIKRSVEQAALLTPALVVLTNLVTYSAGSKQLVKGLIFPSPYIPSASGAGSSAGVSLQSLAGSIKQVDLDHPTGMHSCANPVFDTSTVSGKITASVGGAVNDSTGASATSKTATSPSNKATNSSNSTINTNSSHCAGHKANSSASAKMDPTDAPADSTRGRLIRHMTSLDSQLKRCAAELIFLLCDEDPDEFTSRTGFGNAVALLQIKGLC